MDPELERKIRERRERAYLELRNNWPSYYRRAVEIGHLAGPAGGKDDQARMAAVEAAVVDALAEALEGQC